MKFTDKLNPLFRRETDKVLPQYATLLGKGFSFGEYGDYAADKRRSYSARTEIPLLFNDEEVATLVALVLAEGEGTGSEKNFKAKNLTIPNYFSFVKNKRILIPKKMDDVVAQAYFPLFSINAGREVNPHAGSLEELTLISVSKTAVNDKGEEVTIEKKVLARQYRLGLGLEQFRAAMGNELDGTSSASYRQIIATTNGEDTARYGDPHALFAPPLGPQHSKVLQVVGLLSVRDTQGPLYESSKTWRKPFYLADEESSKKRKQLMHQKLK